MEELVALVAEYWAYAVIGVFSVVVYLVLSAGENNGGSLEMFLADANADANGSGDKASGA
jgi:hypothetical protein